LYRSRQTDGLKAFLRPNETWGGLWYAFIDGGGLARPGLNFDEGVQRGLVAGGACRSIATDVQTVLGNQVAEELRVCAAPQSGVSRPGREEVRRGKRGEENMIHRNHRAAEITIITFLSST
jgi:hypothetical protein